MTAYGSIDTAVEAMRCGAYDYLTKPIDRDRFPLAVERRWNVTPWRSKTSSSRSSRNQDAFRPDGRRERAHAAGLQPGGDGCG